ncbi:MAG: hypothetical protein IT354_17130 [Gemmatimonadaceae bacterium]|nr:hypothetical protein [Gemmatimonadaceae bacterium]
MDAACRANVLEGCYAIPRADIDTGDDRTALALARLGAACRRGDVDACAAVGTPIPPRELCDAGDFESCAAIDDEATLTVACDNKVAKACERLGIRGLEREPPDPRAATYLERACRFGAPKACNYKKSPDVPATGCEGLSVYVIDSAHRRKVPHLHGTNVGGANWSAPPGPILVLFETGDVPSAAYDQIAEHLDVPVLISIEAGGVAARPNLKRAVRVLIDASVAHEHAANGTHPVAGHEIASTNALIDSDDVVRAVFWGVPSEPVSFARCVRHVLQSL